MRPADTFQRPGEREPERIRYCPRDGRVTEARAAIASLVCKGCRDWLDRKRPFKAKRGGES